MGSRFVIASDLRVRRALRAVVFACLFTAPFLVAMSPASADTHVAATLSADNVAYNGTITISATGYKPSSPIDLLIANRTRSSATSASDGTITFTINGSGLSPNPWRARLVGVDPSDQARIATAVFTVTPCVFTGQGSCPGGSFAVTGFAVIKAVGFSLAFVAIGAALIVWRRRRGASGMPEGAAALILSVVVGSVVLSMGPAHAQTTTLPTTSTTAFGSTTTSTTIGAVTTSTFAAVPTTNGAPGSISGTVTADAGGPIADVCVHAFSLNGGFGSARTAANGTYTISNLPPRSYVVAFLDCSPTPTYVTEFFNNHTDFTRDNVQVNGGQAVTGINAALARGGLISGRVTDQATSAAIDRVCVLVGLTADTLNACTGLTGMSGAFGSDVIAAGTYIVGYQSLSTSNAIQYLGSAADPGSSTRLTLAGGDAKSISTALLPGATVSGTVTDAATGGPPLHAICIYDRSADLRTLASGFVFSSTSGAYSVAQLPAGTHKVEFTDCDFQSAPNYITEFFDDKPSLATADPISLTAGQTRAGTNAAMLREGGTALTTTSSTPTAGASGLTTTTSTSIPLGGTSTGAATLSSATATPGGFMAVTGGGFRPGSEVTGFVLSTPVQVGSGICNAQGNITLAFNLPSTLQPGAHSIELRGVDPAGNPRVVSAPLTVLASVTNPTLSRTGREIGTVALLGAAALFLGGLLIRASRRRRMPLGLYPEL